MQIRNIPKVIKAISNEASTNGKEKILRENQNDYLKEILNFTYNRDITFGIKKIDIEAPVLKENEITADWLDHLFLTFKRLQLREVTGHEAQREILTFLNSSDSEWNELIMNILNKDLRMGCGTKTINKVYKKLLPTEFCMLANKYNEKKISYPVYVDCKLDGIRCIAEYKNDEIKLYTRSGKLLKNYKDLEESLHFIASVMEVEDGFRFDGEITIKDGDFQTLMRTVNKKDDGVAMGKDAIFNIFDIIDPAHPNSILSERISLLFDIGENLKTEFEIPNVTVNIGEEVESYSKLMECYNRYVDNGFEGIVIKPLDGIYEYKRSYSWMKLKPVLDLDLLVIDIEEGTGKYKGSLGAIVCDCDGVKVNVGSGYSDEERQSFWNDREFLIGKTIEINYQEKTKDGSLRFPIFGRFRFDRS
jgi:DNA ligase-1